MGVWFEREGSAALMQRYTSITVSNGHFENLKAGFEEAVPS